MAELITPVQVVVEKQTGEVWDGDLGRWRDRMNHLLANMTFNCSMLKGPAQ